MKKRVKHVFKVFLEKYPKAFFPDDSAETKPLRMGVFTLLTAQNREFSRELIASFLKIYTEKDRYLRAIMICPYRVELDGSSYEPVFDGHRQHAFRKLSERQQLRLKEAA